MFNPSRAEPDINPPHGTFTSEELAITGGPNPSPSPAPGGNLPGRVGDGRLLVHVVVGELRGHQHRRRPGELQHASWRLQSWNVSSYVDVRGGASGYPVAGNQYNTVTFASVSTTRLRVLLQSVSGFSVGLLEVKAFAS